MSNRLVASHIDDRGAPNLGAPPAAPPEQRFLSMPTAWTSPIRSVSAPRRASPQRTTSLFTVCQSQPSSAATSSTERPRRPTPMVTHRAATGLTQRAGLAGTDHHPKRCTLTRVVDPYQINVAQAYQQLAHARRISFHRGPPTSDVFSQHPIMEDPPSLLVDYHSPWQIPDSPLISEEPEYPPAGSSRPPLTRAFSRGPQRTSPLM